MLAILPVLAYFVYWFFLILKDRKNADYTRTMRLSFISATCLNVFFIYLFLGSSQVMQVMQ
jgi:1,4-dihydroxy-2-naphthoate octaprenyltransferase